MEEKDFLPENFDEILAYLKKGGIAILPTDTIPGFSADPENEMSVHHISKFKKRPLNNPFLLLVPDFLSAERLCRFSESARKLANTFWPGPLTLLLPRKKGVLPHFFSQEKELAIRIPGDDAIRKFLHIFGKPLVSTSVNISGLPPMRQKKEIQTAFDSCDILLALLPVETEIKPESAIVRVNENGICILREGIISKHKIMQTQ